MPFTRIEESGETETVMGLDGLGLKHLALVFTAAIIAGALVVLIDGWVIVPIESKILTGVTVTPA